MNSLGRLYENGKGVERNLQKAFEYYQNAAKSGHPGKLISKKKMDKKNNKLKKKKRRVTLVG